MLWTFHTSTVGISFYSGVTFFFSSFPPPRPRPRPRPPPLEGLLLVTSKPFELNLRCLGQRKDRSRKMYWMTFWWPWLKVMAVTLINKNFLVCRIKWEPLNWSLQNLVAISPFSCVSPDYILEKFCYKLLFCKIFFENFGCVFLKVKHSIGHISGMVGPIDVKRKVGASVGYWVNHVTLTFDLTHDLDLVVSRSKFEITLFEEWGEGGGGWLTWDEMDMSWSFITMTVTYG